MSHKHQNAKSGMWAFFLTILILGSLIFAPVVSRATDAGLLNNGVQQFFDNAGNPLTSGKVYFYEVGTSTFKDTYTSSAATIVNTNPITLNAGGKAPTGGIYGTGLYRQLLKDKNGNVVWDAVTSPGGSGGSTPTLVGDGNLVGTTLPWSGLVAPNQYVFAYGQEISRTTYPEFYTAVTQQANVICSASSNTLTGVADTTQINIGSAIELSLCVISGTTVVSKTASTVTLSNPSSVSINAVAVFFPYGNGNGTTTFNVPDLRGYAVAGRDNMGGSAAGRLTSTYFNSPALGAVGGSQSTTISTSNLPAVKPAITITDPGHAHSSIPRGIITGGNGNTYFVGTGNTASASDLATTTATTGITAAFTNNLGSSTAFSIVQPTITLNYVIKITPDTSTSIATGVYSIGGMTGIISCGTGILCTGNIISFAGSVLAGGSTGSIQFKNADGTFSGSPNAIFISPNNLTLGAAGTSFLFDIFGSTSGRVRQTVPAIAGTTNVVWGNSSGTPAVTASLPVVLNSTTGNLTCPTCLTASGGSLTATSPIIISGNNVSITGQALTRTNDSNVTLTLDSAAATSLVTPSNLTLGWTGQLIETRGGTNQSSYATGDTLYASAANTLSKLTGNITTTRKFLRQTGSGAASAAPVWDTITTNDVPSAAFTASSDTNVTATLAGSPTTAVLSPMSFTLGWTGTLAAARLNSNVVQGVTNDTNITGSISAQNLTFAWAGTLANSRLATMATNTIKGNATSGTASPTDLAIGSCDTATKAVQWTTNTGFGCNSSITANAVPAANLTGSTLASGVTGSSLTSVGTLGSGGASTGFTISAANVTWSGQIPGVSVAAVANASGSPSATFGVMKCDGTTITCTSGVITAVGAVASSIGVGSTAITSGATTRILYDNGGLLGEYTISGSGTSVAMATSPSFTTPTLGVATATSINKMAITAPATSSTLAIADGKTATISNTLTFTGTDASSVALGTGGTVTYTIASGAKALATSAIASAACTTAQTDTATGTATTDAIAASFNADPTAVTGYIPLTAGMLTIIAYPTLNTVNFKVCNNTGSSITPGAITINWRVMR